MFNLCKLSIFEVILMACRLRNNYTRIYFQFPSLFFQWLSTCLFVCVHVFMFLRITCMKSAVPSICPSGFLLCISVSLSLRNCPLNIMSIRFCVCVSVCVCLVVSFFSAGQYSAFLLLWSNTISPLECHVNWELVKQGFAPHQNFLLGKFYWNSIIWLRLKPWVQIVKGHV